MRKKGIDPKEIKQQVYKYRLTISAVWVRLGTVKKVKKGY